MNERQTEVLRMLRTIPKSDLYEGAHPGNSKLGSGRFYVSYGGGRGPILDQAEVDELLRERHIKLKWKDAPEAKWYVLI